MATGIMFSKQQQQQQALQLLCRSYYIYNSLTAAQGSEHAATVACLMNLAMLLQDQELQQQQQFVNSNNSQRERNALALSSAEETPVSLLEQQQLQQQHQKQSPFVAPVYLRVAAARAVAVYGAAHPVAAGAQQKLSAALFLAYDFKAAAAAEAEHKRMLLLLLAAADGRRVQASASAVQLYTALAAGVQQKGKKGSAAYVQAEEALAHVIELHTRQLQPSWLGVTHYSSNSRFSSIAGNAISSNSSVYSNTAAGAAGRYSVAEMLGFVELAAERQPVTTAAAAAAGAAAAAVTATISA